MNPGIGPSHLSFLFVPRTVIPRRNLTGSPRPTLFTVALLNFPILRWLRVRCLSLNFPPLSRSLARWIFPTFLPSLLFQFRFPLSPAHFRRFCHCFTGVSPKSSHLSPDFRLKGLQLGRDLAKTDVLSARVIERRGRQLSFGKCTLAGDSYLEAGRLLARL